MTAIALTMRGMLAILLLMLIGMPSKMLSSPIPMDPEEVEMHAQEIEMNPQEVMMYPEEIEMNPQEVVMYPDAACDGIFTDSERDSASTVSCTPNIKLTIKITLPDARQIDGISWETTPFDIAKQLSKSVADRAVISKVNGVLWDLWRPFEEDSTVQILDFENDEGKAVFWHSSAHVLGEACELHYGCHLSNGPPVEDGFYYDMAMDKTVQPADYEDLEKLAKKAVDEKQPPERVTFLPLYDCQ
ncbi:threonine---tRNA ligase [Synchytrium endobioticum]|uniref:threonine--tRNA ligase n=1 Tax=Synchytrium endobioticum TaxID=286115 RepID=A0A507CV17_9FUNG|nr:threonine---tRNA ligase [Synchytrium endobioticum]